MEQYNVMGMTCAACSARVEKAVLKVNGVQSCSVNLLTNSMGVEGTAKPQEIIEAVKRAGYTATLKTKDIKNHSKNTDEEDDALKDTETPKLLRRFIISLVFLIILMYLSMGHVMWHWPLPPFIAENYIAIGILELLLTIIIMIINQRFFINGFKSLFHRSPNMDTLVALGSSAAFIYSLFTLFAMTNAVTKNDASAMKYLHEFYFESAAMILTLITLGKTLESYSKGKTTNALKGLMKLAPKTATIIQGDSEIEVAIEQVKKGDIFIVRAGENIPVDGLVIEGNAAINESSLTGESIPIDKKTGDAVSAGTINQSGFIRCEATRVGEDTTLSQIIQMVSEASATKAPIAKVADKVSGIFVPTVIIISVITFIVWMIVKAFTGISFSDVGFSLSRAISVLVISCPCALGLATPVAIMVGNGIGAKHGILFKTASSLEVTGKATIVALDKTGTITLGKPKVTDILPNSAISERKLLQLAYSLEIKSEHPLAHAIIEKAQLENINELKITDFKTVSGNGLMATLDGELLCGGNLSFIKTKNVLIDEEMISKAENLSNDGKTAMFFSLGTKFLGIIAVADIIKEDSPKAIKQLQDMGIKVIMITGDNARTANAIGRQVGVDEVIAEILPNGKANIIQELKKHGKVIMVGDGINDAPALTGADIGMAIGAGTDVAIDAADVVLMKNTLLDVPAAVKLSRATLHNIHENLFWAFIYNILGIPLAAGVFIPIFNWQLNPMYGAAAMSLSSFFVVSNSLRLNLFNIYKTQKRKKSYKENNIMEKTLKITGMMCGHCEARVKKALESINGVEFVEVDHKKGTAVVRMKNDIPNEILKIAVEDQDYTVTEIK